MTELTMREIQLVSLEILHTVATICEEQNFRYSLIYGTLIGAIRHHGYIPWDDDVDIMMPRRDYDQFLEYMKIHRKEYPDLRIFNLDECKEYPYMITRISDDRYIIKMENEKPYGMGVFIDIYPYDGLGTTEKEAVTYGMKGDRLSSLCYQSTREHFAIETTTSLFRKIIKYPVFIGSKLIGKDYFQKKLNQLVKLKEYEDSNYDQFLEYMKIHRKEYPDLRIFNLDECKEYPYMITRISDDRYIIKMENEKPYGMGVFIDIYPYDGLGTTEKEAVTYGMKGDRLSSLCYQSTREHFAIETTTSLFRKIIKYPVFIGSKLIGKDYFQKKLNQLVKLKEYEDSNYIGCVIWLSGGKKEIFLRKWFDETVMVPFEKYQFRVPKDYDEVLRHTYGDYMQLPPEKDRIGHHYFKAYRKDE